MISEKQALFLAFEKASTAACKILQDEKFPFLTQEHIWHILIYELDHQEQPTDIIWHRLTTDDIVVLVKAYFLKYGLPVADFNTDTSTGEITQVLEKATIKIDGHIYKIYKNDLDPLPSQPHAHDLIEHVKIHLGTGEKYRNSWPIGKKLHRKDLKELRAMIHQQMPDLTLPAFV